MTTPQCKSPFIKDFPKAVKKRIIGLNTGITHDSVLSLCNWFKFTEEYKQRYHLHHVNVSTLMFIVYNWNYLGCGTSVSAIERGVHNYSGSVTHTSIRNRLYILLRHELIIEVVKNGGNKIYIPTERALKEIYSLSQPVT